MFTEHNNYLTPTQDVLEEVFDERQQQDIKWGEQNHDPFKWLAILGEEVGEVNRAALEKDYPNYREELIQVAAVAVAMVESFDRQSSDQIKTEGFVTWGD